MRYLLVLTLLILTACGSGIDGTLHDVNDVNDDDNTCHQVTTHPNYCCIIESKYQHMSKDEVLAECDLINER